MRRAWLLALVGIFVLVSVVLAAGETGWTKTVTNKSTSGKTSNTVGKSNVSKTSKAGSLTPEQRKEFVSGAKEVGGLSDAQVSAALKSPAAVEAIPVSAEVKAAPPEAVPPPEEEVQPQDGETMRAAVAPSSCSKFNTKLEYKNARGRLLASFRVSRSWCWNNSAVTSVTPPVVEPVVTSTGERGGWSYKGIIGSKDYYFAHEGHVRGGHLSYRKGKFTICAPEVGCLAPKTPWVRTAGYYDGVGNQAAAY